MIKAVVFDYGGVLIKHLRLQPMMYELRRDLEKNGIKTAILSNMYSPVTWAVKTRGDLKEFDPVIVSSDVGCSKPRPEIYKIVLERLGLPAGACLFIDNKPRNIKTAEQLGFETMLVKKPSDTVLAIRKMFSL